MQFTVSPKVEKVEHCGRIESGLSSPELHFLHHYGTSLKNKADVWIVLAVSLTFAVMQFFAGYVGALYNVVRFHVFVSDVGAKGPRGRTLFPADDRAFTDRSSISSTGRRSDPFARLCCLSSPAFTGGADDWHRAESVSACWCCDLPSSCYAVGSDCLAVISYN